jgi:hypothetical protein
VTRTRTKTANKRAIKALPALRASLLWFKRETVRHIERRAQDAVSPKLRIVLAQKARKVATTDLADLRNAYECERVNEIIQARRFELSGVVPNITWLRAH